MFVHLDPLVVIQLFAILQGVTTAGVVLLSRPRRAASTWLGLWLLALTAQVVDYFLSSSGVYFRHRDLYFAPLFFSWGFGPLLYAYVRTLLAPSSRIGRWHFAPLALQVAFYVVMFLQPLDVKARFWSDVHKPLTRYIEYYGAALSVGVYLTVSLRSLKEFGDAPAWLRRFLIALAVVYAVAAIDPLLNAAYAPSGAPRFFLSTVLLPPFVYVLALRTFLHGRARPNARSDDRRQAVRAATAEMARAVDPAHIVVIRRAFEAEQLHRDPELTLDALAARVGMGANVVSQAINAGLGQSFNDLVNGYRIAEVQRLMSSPDAGDDTVLRLAFDAGFNSKTTFNRVFKERTGLTPREYRKRSRSTHRDDTRSAVG